ncbi:MAG: hypothetical protein E7161_04485 [Firmicutes bacterium]|nr:hypothetical protein [Bacillota bacterium]
MTQLRYLIDADLYKVEKNKNANGSFMNTYVFKEKYKVQPQEIIDEISANMYGANINKMLRIRSSLKRLEQLLQSKVNNTQDNISTYIITIKNVRYKITSVMNNWIDLERL